MIKRILYRDAAGKVCRKEWDGIKGHRNTSGLHVNPTPEQRKEFADFIRQDGVDYLGGSYKIN